MNQPTCSMVVALSLVALSGLAAGAQTTSDLAIGTRVRVTHSLSPRSLQVARVVGSNGDSVIVEFIEAATRPPITSTAVRQSGGGHLVRMSDLEVPNGHRTHGKAGAVFGAVSGLLTGALVGSAWNNSSCQSKGALNGGLLCPSKGETATVGGALGLLIGGGIGGAIGMFTRSERWISASNTSKTRPLPSTERSR